MATVATGVFQSHYGRSSSISERNQHREDLTERDDKSRQRRVAAKHLSHRLTLEAEAGAQGADDTSAASTPRYLDLSFQERTRRIQNLADKVARRRKLREQGEQRFEKQESDQQHKEKWQRRRQQRLLEKNDEILEWRDTFEVRQVPPDIEKQFLRSGKVPARHENWWLVPARTSNTMLERA